MNLIWHVVRKDLQRLRGWLLAWVVVVALPLLLGAGLLVRNPFTGPDWNVPNLLQSLLVLEGLVAYGLILLLVQEDALVGTRSFWLTRPIGPGRLLGAKGLGAVIMLGVLPLALTLPWWIWCGLNGGEMALAALEWCLLASRWPSA